MRWFYLAPASLALAVVVFIGAPILALFADAAGNLTRWLSWLQTTDATLDGDQYWRDPVAHPLVNRLPRYYRRVLWMWRNPGGGFDLSVAGIDVLPCDPRRIKGDSTISNQPYRPGWLFARVGRGWVLYVVQPTLPGRCLRLYLGWKLLEAVQKPDFTGAVPLVLTFNPIMRRS